MDSNTRQTFDLLRRVMKALASTFGSHCEVVLHDFADPERSIIAIENGHVTGREVGNGLDDLGFAVLRNPKGQDMLSYRARTTDGKELRSSTIFLYDEHGAAYGALCINVDLNWAFQGKEFFDQILGTPEISVRESFQKHVDEVLDTLIQDAIHASGKTVELMDRDEKMSIVASLDSRGAFLIRYSVERIASALNVSKYTLYNYLGEIRIKE